MDNSLYTSLALPGRNICSGYVGFHKCFFIFRIAEIKFGEKMRLDDREYFQTQLSKVMGNAPIELRSHFEQSRATIARLNIDSFDMLLNILQNPQIDETSRLDACWIAGQLGNKKLTKALLSLFNESSTKLVWQAAQSLRCLQSKKALSPLLNILRQNENFEKRQAAVYALGALPDTTAIQALMETLIDKNENAKVRGQAAETLAFIGKGWPQVISSLLSVLQDEEVEVRFWSLYTLGQLGSLEIIPPIEKLIDDETILSDWGSVSSEASSAIEQIKSRNLMQ
jgi:HEAT repeat protein